MCPHQFADFLKQNCKSYLCIVGTRRNGTRKRAFASSIPGRHFTESDVCTGLALQLVVTLVCSCLHPRHLYFGAPHSIRQILAIVPAV